MKRLIKKILGREKVTSQQYIEYLRKNGCEVGNGTFFYNPGSTIIDPHYLHCIEIGKDCSITRGVKILAHDYSYSVLNKVYGVLPQNNKITVIGDNVFIGWESIILMGTHIGNNVIIGAGSVVHGDIPDNTVWSGNPAKQICTLEDYYIKKMKFFEDGAVSLARQIVSRYGRNPTCKEMGMYIALFLERTETNKKYFDNVFCRLENAPENLWKMPCKYKSLGDFLRTNNILKTNG